MSKIFISLVIVMVVVAGLLMFQAKQAGTSVVLTPTDLIARAEAGTISARDLSRLRVAGRVSEEVPIAYQTEPFAELKFGIHNPGSGSTDSPAKPLPVVYRGLKPDMFTVGRDVILDGEFSQGVFQASNLLTQCPSKYEAPSPEKKYGVASDSASQNSQ